MQAESIIVTGAEGFLGRKVVEFLLGDGRPVLAVDRVPHTGDSLPNVTYHQSDLLDPSSLCPSGSPSVAPFTLVHLAWDMRRHQGYGIQADQVVLFARLLDHWKERGLGRVIAMGSAEEYGSAAGTLNEESVPCWPLSPYGWAKRTARDLLRCWSSQTGIASTWLRPFIIYGPGQGGDLLVPSAIRAAREQRRMAFTDGKQRRDFIYVDDVAAAVAAAASVSCEGYREYNLGRGEGVEVAEVLKRIAAHYGAEALFDIGARPRRPGEPDVQVADSSRAREDLGWSAGISLEEGLKRSC